MGHRAEEEHVNHQSHIRPSALPWGSGVPDGHAHDGNDIRGVLGTSRKQNQEHQNRGQYGLAVCLITILVDAEVGQQEGDEAWNHDPKVAVSTAARDLTNHAYERDIRAMTEHIVGILGHKTLEPGLILSDDVFGRRDQHRCHEHHGCPESTRGQQTALVAREEEKGKTHDAVKLDERAEHDQEGCPEVAFLADQIIAAHDNGCDGNVELLHLDGVEQLMGAEPEDDDLLPVGEEVVSYSHIQTECERHEPQQHTQPYGWQGEGGDDQ